MTNFRLFIILLLFAYIQASAIDCDINPFINNYGENIKKQDIYFIKCLKIETVYHGMIVKILEDYKSNQISDTIKVWCSDGNSPRYEYSRNFDNNDTLLMIITRTDLEGNDPGDNNNIPDTLESENDYMTIHCNISILNYKNDSVHGRIISIGTDTTISYEYFVQLINEFQSLYQIGISLLRIYPNPANNQIRIVMKEWGDQVVFFDIFNISGQLVESGHTIDKSEYTYDINHLSKGIYIVRFYFGPRFPFNNYKLIKL